MSECTNYAGIDLTRHPALKEAYRIAVLIEACGASVELTTASSAAFDFIKTLDAALPRVPPEASGSAEAWLFHCWTPGKHMAFASVEKDDHSWWPSDQWKGVTRCPLALAGPPELVHGVSPPSERIASPPSAEPPRGGEPMVIKAEGGPFTLQEQGQPLEPRATYGTEHVLEFLDERLTWLDREMRHGGNYEHLKTRYEECSYIATCIMDTRDRLATKEGG